MSIYSVHGIGGSTYDYTSTQLYQYLNYVPTSATNLERTFREFGIAPNGQTRDLQRLGDAMYSEYSKQVQNQIDNQNNTKEIPWENLCAQIGLDVTGDYQTDYDAFNSAINLLSQSAIDGQSMAYFAGIRSEGQKVFGANSETKDQTPITFEVYQANFL